MAGTGLEMSTLSQKKPVLTVASEESHPNSALLTVETAGIPPALGPARATPVRGLVFHLVHLSVARVIRGPETQKRYPPDTVNSCRTGKMGRTEAVTQTVDVNKTRNLVFKHADIFFHLV